MYLDWFTPSCLAILLELESLLSCILMDILIAQLYFDGYNMILQALMDILMDITSLVPIIAFGWLGWLNTTTAVESPSVLRWAIAGWLRSFSDGTRPGKRLQKTMENHHVLMGKSTISMFIFNSSVSHYQRVLVGIWHYEIEPTVNDQVFALFCFFAQFRDTNSALATPYWTLLDLQVFMFPFTFSF